MIRKEFMDLIAQMYNSWTIKFFKGIISEISYQIYLKFLDSV